METKFNFKSQICTSRFQSEHLLALGLKKETADMCYKVTTHDFKGNEINEIDRHYTLCCWYDESSLVCGLERKETIPAWSLHRLIETMPNNIHKYNDIADLSVSNELVQYRFYDVDYNHDVCLEHFNDGTLYNNIIDCIEWLIKEGYFNKEYLEE